MGFKASLDKIAFAAHEVRIDDELAIYGGIDENFVVFHAPEFNDTTFCFNEHEIEIDDGGSTKITSVTGEDFYLTFSMVRPMVEQDLNI